MSKFLYPIYKLNIESYKKWWLYHKKAGGSGILSEILQGFSFNLENTLNRKFKLFEIEGNSVQDGTPSSDNEVPILSSGDNGSINEKIQNKNFAVNNTGSITRYGVTFTVNEDKSITANGTATSDIYYVLRNDLSFKAGETWSLSGCNGGSSTTYELYCYYIGDLYNGSITKTLTSDFVNIQLGIIVRSGTTLNNVTFYPQLEKDLPTPYVPHEDQDYSIFVQQPMRSIGDVRDCFVKKSDGKLYERHLPYIASYNGETLPQDVYNEVDNVKYCNEKSMSTTGQFSIGASVQYIDENNWNDLPCTEEQIQQLENKPSTYKDFTIIQSQDETPAHLKIQYYKEG